MNSDIDRQPPDGEKKPDAPAPADGEDVITFYDSEGAVRLALPAHDVVLIAPESALVIAPTKARQSKRPCRASFRSPPIESSAA